ncbi:MAG: hypothetical protein KAW45_01640 [Thermoplasmatales archaeon]|nr:hypothetical protein [Thermoplasmatales archaeon]
MSEIQKQTGLRNIEGKLTGKYSILTKLFLIISILLIIWIIIVFAGVSSLGYNWAGLSLDGWIITLCALFGFFIILELIFYSHYKSIKDKRVELEKPKPEFMSGRRVYVYTHPEGKEGGIFSKTYVEIDEHRVLRLRSLMIPPEELW